MTKQNKPICKTDSDGNKSWYLNGKLHREDGPAVEHASGTKRWFYHGKLHREDGPAVEYADGSKHWYLNGEFITDDPLVAMIMFYDKTK